MIRRFAGAAVLAALLAVPGCSSQKQTAAGDSKSKPSYAFVTNGVADFWNHAAAGANKAGSEIGADVTVIMPESMTDQTRKIEDLLTRGTDGIAISTIDPANEGDILNKAADQTVLISHDSDAPQSKRQVYIGMHNYDAGLLCGQTLRKAMPDGGSVAIFIGRMDQDNSQGRRQGFIDGLFDRKPNPSGSYPLGDELKSDDGKFTILGTMTDQFDKAKAKANVEDTVTRHPDITGMVGLFEYNPPLILEALERTGKLGKVKVMGFDENPATLQGIKDGNVVATVVQNPYQYGYKSVSVLNELHKGNKSVIPENKFIDIPARVIDSSNLAAFQKELQDEVSKK
jgi:ribose transport system substrate-binding protein